ncbi:MAG TPA: Os1348 family NHLP clan protein [Thermodesulfobacteriota bacterium]
MSQQAVERALGRLVTDPAFRRRFYREPERASLELGLDLSAGELEALQRVPCLALAELAARLDDRLRRLSLPDEPATDD